MKIRHLIPFGKFEFSHRFSTRQRFCSVFLLDILCIFHTFCIYDLAHVYEHTIYTHTICFREHFSIFSQFFVALCALCAGTYCELFGCCYSVRIHRLSIAPRIDNNIFTIRLNNYTQLSYIMHQFAYTIRYRFDVWNTFTNNRIEIYAYILKLLLSLICVWYPLLFKCTYSV